MARRWAAWLVVLVALVVMITVRLADRKERVARMLSTTTRNEPARPESTATPGGEN